MEIGEKIKELRKKKGYTQRDLADLLGISHSNVSFWERGINAPRFKELQKLCDIFGVDISYFADDVDNAKRIVSLFNALNEEGQDRLVEYGIMLMQNGYIKSNQHKLVEKEA